MQVATIIKEVILTAATARSGDKFAMVPVGRSLRLQIK